MATPTSSGPNSIAYVAVARLDDQVLLAERWDKAVQAEERKAVQGTLTSLLQRGLRLKYPGWKDQSLCPASFDGTVYAVADSQALLVVAVAVRGGLYPYPPRVAWQLLQDLLQVTPTGDDIEQGNLRDARSGALASTMMRPMQDLMKKYREPGQQDAVASVHQKVDNVKGLMHDNIKKILETHTTIETLQDKSSEMNQSAEMFVKQSHNLKRQMQIRNLKVKAIAAISVVALGTYLVMAFWPTS